MDFVVEIFANQVLYMIVVLNCCKIHFASNLADYQNCAADGIGFPTAHLSSSDFLSLESESSSSLLPLESLGRFLRRFCFDFLSGGAAPALIIWPIRLFDLLRTLR